MNQHMKDMLSDYEDIKTCITFANMISTGRVAQYLETKKAVPMHEARWRNHTTRIMSLFCRTRRPSPALIILVTFIVQAYVPTLMEVFFNPELWNGSIHWFNYLKRAQKCLSRQHFDFIIKVEKI